jgi:tetratricopeptide (TPR) repeat protein
MDADEKISEKPAVAITEVAVGFVIDQRYEVSSRLGAGVMSDVYRARDLLLNRDVAIKILHQHLSIDADAIVRFQQEAIAVAALDHPHIVRVYGSSVWQSRPYLAMEFVDGITLADWLKKNSLPQEQAVAIFLQILDALQHAHSRGILHRDIRPSNVMLSDGNQLAKIMDFGIAKILPESGKQWQTLTRTGQLFGTLRYMSPERCMGFPATVQSDLYSMGCLMYETLFGVMPIQGETDGAIVHQHREGQPGRKDNLRSDLGRVIQWTLAKEPERRPESAADLKEAVAHPKAFRSFVPKGSKAWATLWLSALVITTFVSFCASLTWQQQMRSVRKSDVDAMSPGRAVEVVSRRGHVTEKEIPLLQQTLQAGDRQRIGRGTLGEQEDWLLCRLLLSEAFRNVGRFDEAMEQAKLALDESVQFERATKLSLRRAEALALMSETAIAKDDRTLAADLASRSLGEIQESGDYWAMKHYADLAFRMGNVLMDAGRPDAAIKAFQSLVDSKLVRSQRNLTAEERVYAYLRMAQANLQIALATPEGSLRRKGMQNVQENLKQILAVSDGEYEPVRHRLHPLVMDALRLTARCKDKGDIAAAANLLNSVEQFQEKTGILDDQKLVRNALLAAKQGDR